MPWLIASLFRTWKFAVLGMSLSSVFESKGIDVLKALTLILNEYDQLPDQPPDEISRPKMVSEGLNVQPATNY